MNVVAWWLMALMMFEFALGTFLVFIRRGVAWYNRAVAALFSLGCGLIFLVLAIPLAQGHTETLPSIEPKMLIGLFLFVNLFGFKLVAAVRRDGAPSGCLGMLLKGAGCVVVGWAGFALVVLMCALAIGLGGYFS
ncbi:MAG: hypothetical protein ABIU10_00935 [Sphingomicrobium sp.]